MTYMLLFMTSLPKNREILVSGQVTVFLFASQLNTECGRGFHDIDSVGHLIQGYKTHCLNVCDVADSETEDICLSLTCVVQPEVFVTQSR